MDALKVVFVLHTFTLVCSSPVHISNAENKGRIPGEYILTLEFPGDIQAQENFVQDTRARIKDLSADIRLHGVYRFRSIVILHVLGNEDAAVASAAGSIPGIRGLEANVQKNFIENHNCIDQSAQGTSWGLPRISYTNLPNYAQAVYKYPSSAGEETHAYVFDTGVYLDHEEFEGRAEHGFTAEKIQPEGDDDLNGHGTHVAGTIIGHTYGVAKSAKVISVKVLHKNGTGTVLGIIQGAHWVFEHFTNQTKQKAVASLSLGAGGSTVLDKAMDELLDAGMAVVTSAGNFGIDACGLSPARHRTVVTVGATDYTDNMAWFSNTGTCVDILAPGMYITSAGISSPNATWTISGTSMSAPHVSGAILLYLGEVQSATPSDIREWLLTTATPDVVKVHSDTPSLLLYVPCPLISNPETSPNPISSADPNPGTSPNPNSSIHPNPETSPNPKTNTNPISTSSPNSSCDAAPQLLVLMVYMVALLLIMN